MTRSGELRLVKECSEWAGGAGDHCTVTVSNLGEIPVGARIVYAEAAGEGMYESDIVLDAGQGNSATGHVVVDLKSGAGTVVITGGRGTLSGLTGKADVSPNADGTFNWTGTYSLSEIGDPVPARA